MRFVTRHGVSIDNWLYWILKTRNYEEVIGISLIYTYSTSHYSARLVVSTYLHYCLPDNGSQQCPLLLRSLPAGDCLAHKPWLQLSSHSRLRLSNSKVNIKVMLRRTVIRPVCLGFKNHLGSKTRFLLLSDSCGFVDVGRPIWREDGSVV
jgi:hypothetical protein